MYFVTADTNDLSPDISCPECHAGIDAYEDGYETSGALNGSWDIICPVCGHRFKCEVETETRWTGVEDEK